MKSCFLKGEHILFEFLFSFVSDHYFLSLVFYLFMIITFWRIFKKAGRWGIASLIPIYNVIVLFQIARLSPWLLLLCFIPDIGVIISSILWIVLQFKLAQAFGKGFLFALGLMFFGFIFYPILAFSDAQYNYYY